MTPVLETTTIEPALMSVADAALYLGGVSPDLVREMIARGELSRVRLSRRVMVKKCELDRLIELNTEREEMV
jgi:excisionase family DNA binding protein